jgi:hypothetical protein
LGADEGEVNDAIRTLVPALVGGLQHNVQADDIDSSKLESAVTAQAASGLLKQLLPILAPIVLAYIGKQLTKGNAAPGEPQAQNSGGGGLGDVLGNIVGGGGGGGNNPLGSILGSVLGGGQGGGGLGDILGGLLRGKK